MADHHKRAGSWPGSRALLGKSEMAVACLLAFGLAGCVTTMIGEPIAIRIPANLSEEEAQGLVTEFVEGNKRNTSARASGSIYRKVHGKWQIEQWEPGSMVAVYSWRSHLLRVNIEFANRTALLEIGESANLRQSSQRIHKIAKALAMELAQDVRLGFAKAALSQRPQGSYVSQRSGSKKSSFCSSMWEGDVQEQASCKRAQQRSYDRLRPLISEVKTKSSSPESRRLRACYAGTQTWAGADWEAIERCFYSPPASKRY
jgi:hypothetical protein